MSHSAGDDHVVPFQVDALDVRGRAVRLGPMLNAILAPHQYPQAVSRLLAEVITLSVLLGSSLKFDGRFIIQTQSDGPVSFLVVDFTTPDGVRAYARYDEKLLDQYIKAGKTEPQQLLGKGVLAMTIDQGAKQQRYQGIVELDGMNLEDAAHQYFRQSEQIPTRVRLTAAQLVESDEENGSKTSWRAGGLIAQFLPDATQRMAMGDLHGGDNPNAQDDDSLEEQQDEMWREALSLVDTVQDDELTDPQLDAEQLLYRLFHERGVTAFDPIKMTNKCGCSREKLANVINSLTEDERNDALAAGEKPGIINSKCEFCGAQYDFSAEDLVSSK